MHKTPFYAGVLTALTLAACSPGAPERLEARDGGFVRDGRAAFVVTHFAYALGPDTQGTAQCPNGMSQNVVEIFGETEEGRRRPGEDTQSYSERLQAGGMAISAAADGRNYCMHPDIAPEDPHTRILSSAEALAEGLDLDGVNSRSTADQQSGLLDFSDGEGRAGIDNQFWRAVGCNRSFQSDGLSNEFEITMYTGSWGILVTLDDLDDLENDDHVKVGFYANADPIQLSPTREALEFATYAMAQDPAYRAETTGKITNGVLTTEPVDVRFENDVNGLMLDRTLKDARVQAQLSEAGVLEGYLGGYTPVEELYDFQFGYRSARLANGELAPVQRRLGTANGAARVLGHTCQGAWQSLHRLADGRRDPETGHFTAISTQYTFEARPAFAVDVETRGVNEALVQR